MERKPEVPASNRDEALFHFVTSLPLWEGERLVHENQGDQPAPVGGERLVHENQGDQPPLWEESALSTRSQRNCSAMK